MAKAKSKPSFAFMFVAPETDTEKHRAMIETPVAKLATVGVKSYKEAAREAKKLVAQGVTIIELCAGFGNEGTAIVSKAVKGKAIVGTVKFDLHPAFDFKSGDEIF